MWIATYDNQKLYPLIARGSLTIESIAHSLALQCRWQGHCREFYSIAEHSVRVARVLLARGYSLECVLAGLLHDITEVGISDLPSPIKNSFYVLQGEDFTPIHTIEIRLLEFCYDCLNLPFSLHQENEKIVKEIDLLLLATEARDLMHGTENWDWVPPSPLVGRIQPWSWKKAKEEFLSLYFTLRKEI